MELSSRDECMIELTAVELAIEGLQQHLFETQEKIRVQEALGHTIVERMMDIKE